MKFYIPIFINKEKNNVEKFLFMAKFTYNNSKILITDYMQFKFNFGHHFYIFFEKKTIFIIKIYINQ